MSKNAISAIVVDDEPDNAHLIKRFFAMSGINVVGEGYNGKEAVELYKTLKPDVTCLDLSMPVYDGFYAIEKIMGYDKNANILIITGTLNQNTKSRLEELGLVHIFYKPLDLEAIAQYVVNLAKN
ncbi:MAG TPA: response regulator [Candidatus Nitrosotenuis sp.]|nr:response regulator [Candidatus Nitrosotenuis sp.]